MYLKFLCQKSFLITSRLLEHEVSVAKQVPLLVKVTNNYNRAIFSIYLCNCHCQIGDY